MSEARPWGSEGSWLQSRHQRSAVALELRNKFPSLHCAPWAALMAVEQLEQTVANIRATPLLSRRSKSRCALQFKRKGAMKEKSTKTIFLLFVTNAQFVLKLDNFASPKCYFLMQSMSVQAALAFKANSVFQLWGLHYQLLRIWLNSPTKLHFSL